MAISRETFDPGKNYKLVRYHQDRDLLDSELNEQQAMAAYERGKLTHLLFNEGAILEGLGVIRVAHTLTVAGGRISIDGHLEDVPGSVLTFDPAKDSGVDYVYVELLKYNYGANQDAGLINPATGEPTAEREKWVLGLKARDTSADTLPNHVTARRVIPIYKFDRDSGLVTATVQQKSNLRLLDLSGTLPGSRITVSSISEDQLSFAAAEGLNSLLQNLAERTFDQTGSFLVRGLDSFLGEVDQGHVEVITNAGRAYVQGYRLKMDLPATTWVPIATATKSVRGEQKTFLAGQRRYSLNSQPLQATTQVEAVVEKVANVTRGSVGGGEDLLAPNPVVDILEVSQGATVYQEGVDWQQSGNQVDWLGSGNEPGIGTSYTVRWTYTKQMVRGEDYVDGGWFGEVDFPEPGTYHYLVTAFDADGETAYAEDRVGVREIEAGGISVLRWLPLNGALGYRVYRALAPEDRTDFMLLAELGNEAISYVDDGVDGTVATVPPENSASTLAQPVVAIEPGNTSLVNFGATDRGDSPVPGSNCSIDYDYYLGRQDILYANVGAIQRLEGAPADNPKLPVVPESVLALCAIFCPPNSSNLAIRNFGLTRITMDQIHQLIRDVEALKYNDAQFQMNNDLQNRDAQTKKGIYSDDFSNEAQSDVFHPDWSARIDPIGQFAAPGRDATPVALEVDEAASQAMFAGSLVLLPGMERILIAQTDYSNTKPVNPNGVFEPPAPSVSVTPNIGRRGLTGVAVTGLNWTPAAVAITLRCDGKVIATDLVADTAGRVKFDFVIPAGSRHGDRIVELRDGNLSATTQLRIHDPLDISRIQRTALTQATAPGQPAGLDDATPPVARIIRLPVAKTVWRQRQIPQRHDPLAQTFRFLKARVISAVGLYFSAKDAVTSVTVQIRGVTTGLPNEVVLAETLLAPEEVELGTETRVAFEDPVYVEANTSYAVVILTGGTGYQLLIATLGEEGQNGIITRQAYGDGVLLESSNAETWTPLNGSDLAMRVFGYEFQTHGEVRFKPVTGVSFSDLNLDEYSAIPEGCCLVWEYSTDGGATWDAIVPAEEERLPNLAAEVLVRVKMTNNLLESTPALNYRDVQLIGYINREAGVYLSREMALTQGVASTKIYTQMAIPSGTTVAWLASNDGGATWEPAVLEETRPIDQTWTEYTYGLVFADPAGARVRFKAEMTGTALAFPRVHTLGATLS